MHVSKYVCSEQVTELAACSRKTTAKNASALGRRKQTPSEGVGYSMSADCWLLVTGLWP